MKNYLVTIRIADGSNYETTVQGKAFYEAYTNVLTQLKIHLLEFGEIVGIVEITN